MAKKPSKRTFVPLMLWDTFWKLLAIRRAIQRRDYAWIAGIVLANTGGVLPMYYLWKHRNDAAEAVPETLA